MRHALAVFRRMLGSQHIFSRCLIVHLAMSSSRHQRGSRRRPTCYASDWAFATALGPAGNPASQCPPCNTFPSRCARPTTWLGESFQKSNSRRLNSKISLEKGKSRRAIDKREYSALRLRDAEKGSCSTIIRSTSESGRASPRACDPNKITVCGSTSRTITSTILWMVSGGSFCIG